MKIALVVPGGVDVSGERRVIPALLALIQRLAARHELHVYALRQQPQPGDWMLRGARIHNLGFESRQPMSWRALAAMRREHRLAPFDIVQSIWADSCGLAAVSAAWLFGLPSVVHLAGGELVALPALGYGGRLRWRGRCCQALVLHGATALTAASAPMLAQIAAHGRTARRVPLGVDLGLWPPQAPLQRDPLQPVRLVHVASLNLVKDQTTLLQALARLAADGVDFELAVVGEDTLGGRIQALALQLGLASRTRFHGFLTQGELRPVLARAHIHLISSRHEAGPLAVLEAAVLGVPSVGTAVGHLAEWAPQAALVAQPGDAAGLALAIRRLVDDEPLRLSIAAEASRRALVEDADHTAAMFEGLHLELLAQHRR